MSRLQLDRANVLGIKYRITDGKLVLQCLKVDGTICTLFSSNFDDTMEEQVAPVPNPCVCTKDVDGTLMLSSDEYIDIFVRENSSEFDLAIIGAHSKVNVSILDEGVVYIQMIFIDKEILPDIPFSRVYDVDVV